MMVNWMVEIVDSYVGVTQTTSIAYSIDGKRIAVGVNNVMTIVLLDSINGGLLVAKKLGNLGTEYLRNSGVIFDNAYNVFAAFGDTTSNLVRLDSALSTMSWTLSLGSTPHPATILYRSDTNKIYRGCGSAIDNIITYSTIDPISGNGNSYELHHTSDSELKPTMIMSAGTSIAGCLDSYVPAGNG